MALTVLRHDRTLHGRDSAEVWAEVADLPRFDAWFPVHVSGAMAGEVPSVGNVLFVSYRRGTDPAEGVRLRVTEWEAGTRYSCEAMGIPGIRDGMLEVRVVGEAPGETHVHLGFTGDADGVTGRLAAFEISRRMRLALRHLAAEE
jgi:Polyketide cyclase / dehydrase and lipid transport